jgi:hypothetical protein
MLVTNNFAVGDIRAFKLVNGDEVIGKVSSITDTEYVIDRPCVVVGGPKGLGLIQAMFSLDPDRAVTVAREHVMMQCDVIQQMSDYYIKTTTGIEPVTQSTKIII